MIQSVEMGTESGASDNSLNTETQRSIGNGFTARGEYQKPKHSLLYEIEQ